MSIIFISLMLANITEAFEIESVLGAWLFDEGKGQEVMDSSGKEHNGTIIGNAEWVDGRFGEALEFGGGSKVEVPHDAKFITPTFTLMAWINVEKPNEQWQLIVGKERITFKYEYLTVWRFQKGYVDKT